MGDEDVRILCERMPAILHAIDAAGRLVIVSDPWLAMMGYGRDEVTGRPFTDFLTPASKGHAVDVVLPALHGLGGFRNLGLQLVTKAGNVREIELSAVARLDDHGAFLGSLHVLHDVTEHKKTERLLIRKTAALERSKEDLRRIAQIASHDLQEPLRRMITYSDVLKEDFGAELSEDAARIAGVIQSGGRRLRLMINDLLAYVSVREHLDHDFEPVDLSAVLGHALDDLQAEIVERGVRVRAAHLPLVWGRAPLLKMVFDHLLSNAIKYGCEAETIIDVSIDDQGDAWRVAVSDRGRGVAARFADRIFEMFQRLQHDDDIVGTGVGLAICRLIIQRCGGDIWLDPSYDRGARFVFTLPKNRPDALESTPMSGL